MEGDVLDAFAVVRVEVLLDLGAVVGGLVDRDADATAGARHRLGLEPGELALDIEVADLAEVEEPLVELRPLGHAAAVHVVREVVDEREARAGGRRYVAAPEILKAGQGPEIDVVDRVAEGILRVTVDQIDERIADSLDRR